MFKNSIISFGISALKKKKMAVLLTDVTLLESIERCRNSFGLEGVVYEFWRYPVPKHEGSIWIKNNKTVLFFLSDGFIKLATESQLVTLLESLNAGNFQKIRQKNKQDSLRLFFKNMKGESRHLRYWIIAFFLYPLERFLKIARI